MAVRSNCTATTEVLINLGININAQNNVSELMFHFYTIFAESYSPQCCINYNCPKNRTSLYK